jgi:hypothetical protein
LGFNIGSISHGKEATLINLQKMVDFVT